MLKRGAPYRMPTLHTLFSYNTLPDSVQEPEIIHFFRPSSFLWNLRPFGAACIKANRHSSHTKSGWRKGYSSTPDRCAVHAVCYGYVSLTCAWRITHVITSCVRFGRGFSHKPATQDAYVISRQPVACMTNRRALHLPHTSLIRFIVCRRRMT